MQLFAAEARGVTKGPTIHFPPQYVLFIKTIESGHHRGVGQVLIAVLHQFADRRTALAPQRAQQTLLERAQLQRRTPKGIEASVHTRSVELGFYRELECNAKILSAVGQAAIIRVAPQIGNPWLHAAPFLWFAVTSSIASRMNAWPGCHSTRRAFRRMSRAPMPGKS